MSKRLWLCVPLISIGLVGCAVAPGAPTTKLLEAPVGCNPGICFVDIWISDCDRPGGIQAEPYKLEVPDRGKVKNIRWRIRNEGYIFRSDGIVITSPDGEFDEPEMSANGQMFKWRDKHSAGKLPYDFKYSVNVVKTGDTPRNCYKYDPYISNQ